MAAQFLQSNTLQFAPAAASILKIERLLKYDRTRWTALVSPYVVEVE